MRHFFFVLSLLSSFSLFGQPLQRYRFTLDTQQPVPVNGSIAVGEGLAVLDTEEATLTLEIRHKVKGVLGAGIHHANIRENGPAVHLFESGSSPIKETWALSNEQLALLSSGELYIAIYSENFPSGEIRGQITHNPAGDPQYVTILNTTKNQIFSPPIVVSHRRGYQLFELGRPASDALTDLAEEGDSAALLDRARSQDQVLDSVTAEAPILPGESVTLRIVTDKAHNLISVAGMLTITNDGFFGAANLERPRPNGERPLYNYGDNDVKTAWAFAYDAGTEANTESCDHIPGSPCGSSGQRATENAEGYIHIHSGVAGVGALDPADYDWRGPVAQIILEDVPSDQESFTIDLNLDLQQPGAMLIQEPSMCAGNSTCTFTYSKKGNYVIAELDFVGLPHRLSVTRSDIHPDYTPFSIDSTPFNFYPDTVEDGIWQFWMVDRSLQRSAAFFYGGNGFILGSEDDLRETGLPTTGIRVTIPTIGQCIGSPLYEGLPDGTGHVRFEFRYDQVLDRLGTPGTIVALIPYQFGGSDLNFYLSKTLPREKTLSWDNFLTSIQDGSSIQVFSSLTPFPKPDYMRPHPNDMPGWQGFQPPRPLSDAFLNTPCMTHIIPPLTLRPINGEKRGGE